MAAGIMNTLLGVKEATACAASVTESGVTATRGTRTGSSNVDVAAIGGDIYMNYGATASATACVRVITSGSSYLVPITADIRVIEKDSGAKYAFSYWR